MRRRKYLLAVKFLLKIRDRAPKDADAHFYAYQLRFVLEKKGGYGKKVAALIKRACEGHVTTCCACQGLERDVRIGE